MALLTLLSGPVQPLRRIPTAKAVVSPDNAVLGVVVRLDGRLSSDPDAQDPRGGADADSIASTDRISSSSASFSQEDLGRYISLDGVDAGEFVVYDVISALQVAVKTSSGMGVSFTGSTGLRWTIFDRLSYSWSFLQVPIGSRVPQESLRLLDTDGSLASFSPDVVGEYVAQLVVSNGSFNSVPVSVQTSVRAILVPHGRGIVPDGKFIWSYVRDVWSQVEGKEWFETLWSALIQIAGSELLKLYQNDFSKSIRDIQDQYQRRWLAYEPKLELAQGDLSLFLGLHRAGSDASTDPVGLSGELFFLPTDATPTLWTASHAYAVGEVVYPTSGNPDRGYYFRCKVAGTSGASEPDWQVVFSEATVDGTAQWSLVSLTKELLLVSGSLLPNVAGERLSVTYDSLQAKNVRSFGIQGLTSTKNGYKLALLEPPPDPLPGRVAQGTGPQFAFQSRTWTLTGVPNVRVGDVGHFPSGPNAGFYRVTDIAGSTFTVDRAPPSFSDGTTVLTYMASFYRPVGFKLNIAAPILSDTIALPYSGKTKDLEALAPGRIITVGGQAHTVLRTTVDTRQVTPLLLVATDRSQVLVGSRGLNWRVPHTLVSKSQDFDALGVTSGDLLILSITDEGSQNTVDVVAQVVGVDRKRLGFVLTDEDPGPGQIPAVPDKTYAAVSDGFRINTVSKGLSSLSFSGEFAELLRQMGSTVFQRSYANVSLTVDSPISLGTRVFRIHPKHVIRNRSIPVDETLRSVPLLQEWIVQPVTGERAGALFQVKDGKEYPLERAPSVMVENSHYIVDNETAFDGAMTFNTGTSTVFVEGANFIDRNIVPGDSFIIDSPDTLLGEFKIIRALDNDRLLLSQPIPLYILSTKVTAKVRIVRKKAGHFLRFTPGQFTAALPAPSRLWAEVSLFDNGQTIEDNFGILVGLTRKDLENISTDVNYRQAVAGLMFAFTKGSAIEKVRLGAQILLGLPFAEHRGVIRAIDNDFRLDEAGVPVLGRLLIEDVDKDSSPLGTQRVYTFTIDLASSLSGVETNPTTKKPYVVGDTVELFALLAKGVEISDYLSSPGTDLSAISQLQQFHVFHMRANDTIFSYKELGLISPFLRKITPSYVAYIITTATELVDNVSVADATTVALSSPGSIIDNPYFGLDTPLMFDAKNVSGLRTIQWGNKVFWVRKSGSDLVSTSLVGPPGSAQTLTLPSGGAVTPSFGTGPITRAGRDKLLIVDGDNQGLYPISAVSDSSIGVTGGPTYGFQPSSSNRYAIVREVAGELRRGSLTSLGAGVSSVELGAIADGVAPGDLLVVDLGGGAFSRHRVSRVGPHPDATALLDGDVETVPGVAAVTGRPYAVFRDSLVQAPFETVTSPATATSNGAIYSAFSDPLLQGLLEPGDELEVNGGAFGRLFVLDPVRRVFSPVLPSGTYSVKVCKRGQPGTSIAFDHLDLGPPDRLEAALVGTSASTSSSDAVSFAEIPNPTTGGVRPSDMLALLAGADSAVDVGYGPGRYPIVRVTNADVRLAAPLTSTGTVGWKIIRGA